ncbi:MAG: phosphatidate cytidylyltransferase [Opitutia bacterium]|jgi:phosphatidate cytidylyltransferase
MSREPAPSPLAAILQRALSTAGLWAAVFLVLWVFGRYDLAQLGGFLALLAVALAAQLETYRLLRGMGAEPDVTVGLVCGGGLLVAQFLGFISVDTNVALIGLAWAGVLLTLLAQPGETKAWVVRNPTVFGLLYVPFLLLFLGAFVGWESRGRNDGLWLAVWVVAVTKFTDVGGLLVGIPLGRHKIAPNVSPAKSWEGCAGGVALSSAVGAAGAWALGQWAGIDFHPAKGALLAIPIALVSIPSDLVESHLKRRAGVKDSGSTIPGIGGALDLVDSLLLVAPVAYLLLSTLTRTRVG